MTFVTLEQRYNQLSKSIYNRFSADRDQLVVIKPNTSGGNIITSAFRAKNNIRNDSRLLPTVSTTRDVQRVSKFLGSREGILFVISQTFLQTGNTFSQTRKYNPAEVLINTTLRIANRRDQRHFDKNSNQSTGGLQLETISKLTSPSERLTSTKNDPTTRFIRPEYVGFSKTEEDKNKAKLGELLINVNPKVLQLQGKESRGEKRQFPNLTNIQTQTNRTTTSTQLTLEDVYTQYTNQLSSGSTTFKTLEQTLSTNGYFDGNMVSLDGPYVDASNDVKTFKYVLKDPLNSFTTSTETNIYSKISGKPTEAPGKDGGLAVYQGNKKSDIITFSFTTQGQKPIHFRAFLSSFKQNVKPTFSEQQYIGRTERFVTYGGARRNATLQFNIAAFSQSEIKEAWARVNYLTGLAFPTGFSQSGFMIPPLFRLTVGKIYEDQPCYLDSLDFDFIDDSITFDVDNEVSQVINVNMSIILLEKRSRFYDSPFYKILETA